MEVVGGVLWVWIPIFGINEVPSLTVIFGGIVITLSENLVLEDKLLKMNLKKTKVSKIDGLNKIPLFSSLLMERWYPVKEVWEKLPWNKVSPSCSLSIKYIDDELRITKDLYGNIFIYIRPTKSI